MLKKITTLLLCLMLTTAFAQPQLTAPPVEPILLASPTVLQATGNTSISLADYLVNPKQVARIETHLSLKVKQLPDRGTLIVAPQKNMSDVPLFSLLNIVLTDGTTYSIPLKKSLKIPYRFSLDPRGKTYQNVQLAGQMNDWNPKNTPLVFQNGVWQTDLALEPGSYQYQLVADGKWMLDPAKTDSVDNNIGGFNSLAVVAGVDRKQLPHQYMVAFDASQREIVLLIENSVHQLVATWNNEAVSAVKLRDRGYGNVITAQITLPPAAADAPRSVLRIWLYNEAGMGNDLYLPLTYARPITDAQLLTRHDHHAQIIYFLMTDRFSDGDPNNNQPIIDERVALPANYQGGDIGGITQKIDNGYFDRLGVNTLWVSPLVQNPRTAYQEYPEPHRFYSGYHGYWPVQLTQVDDRFGTANELKKMVSKAHDKQMNVLLDFVANHVHQESTVWKQHPEWFSPLLLPDGRKNIRIWDEERLTTWFDTFLPSIDHSQPQVCDMLIDTTLHWLNTFDLDGFRHDAVKHIHNIFWQKLTQRLKTEVMLPQKKPLFQIGETFGSRELIGSYVGSGQLDAQFDFNLYFDARSVFAIDKEPFSKLDNSLAQTFDYYGHHSLMGNITGNHDMARFISLASGDLSFAEDPKAAAWSRQIGVSKPVGYQKLGMLHAFITTIPGVPTIYYGDEIGLPGADDPDNRRMMRFNDLSSEEKRLKRNLSKLNHLRRQNMALLYGDFVPLLVTDQQYVYAREYMGNTVIVAFNKSDREQTINIELPGRYPASKLRSQFVHKAKTKKQQLRLRLPAYGYDVLVADQVLVFF